MEGWNYGSNGGREERLKGRKVGGGERKERRVSKKEEKVYLASALVFQLCLTLFFREREFHTVSKYLPV